LLLWPRFSIKAVDVTYSFGAFSPNTAISPTIGHKIFTAFDTQLCTQQIYQGTFGKELRWRKKFTPVYAGASIGYAGRVVDDKFIAEDNP